MWRLAVRARLQHTAREQLIRAPEIAAMAGYLLVSSGCKRA